MDKVKITSTEYAKLHGKTKSTVNEHIKKGKIPAEMINGVWYIAKDAPYPLRSQYKDITGKRFGKLIAIKPTQNRDPKGAIIWECSCDCGCTTYVSVRGLNDRDITSCGCKKVETAKSIQKNGVESAKKSPKSGRFESNVNAKVWTLIAPNGREFNCTNLRLWAREHTDLFGFEPGDHSANKIAHGFHNISQTYHGTRTGVHTYKGWSLKSAPQELESEKYND